MASVLLAIVVPKASICDAKPSSRWELVRIAAALVAILLALAVIPAVFVAMVWACSGVWTERLSPRSGMLQAIPQRRLRMLFWRMQITARRAIRGRLLGRYCARMSICLNRGQRPCLDRFVHRRSLSCDLSRGLSCGLICRCGC